MKIVGEYQRRVRDFLCDYGATEIKFTRKGKHPVIAFNFRGVPYHRTMALTPSRGGAAGDDIAALKRMLGDPIVEGPKQRRSIDDITPPAPVNGVAHRTISDLRVLANGNDSTATTPDEHSVTTRFATSAHVNFDGDNKEYDLVFYTRRKTIASDGSVSNIDRPLLAVTMPTDAVLALFDELQPYVKNLRFLNREPVEHTEEPPAAEMIEEKKATRRPRQSYAEQMPRGFDHVMRLAERVAALRKEAKQTSNGKAAGKGYNVEVKKLYEADTDLAGLPPTIRNYLGEILLCDRTRLRAWAKMQSRAVLAEMTAGRIAYQSRQMKPAVQSAEDDHIHLVAAEG